VERGAHAPELEEDLAAVLVEPLPHALDERLAAELLPGGPLLEQHLLDDVLRRDPGVVVAGLEEGVEAGHALPADHRVADRELEGVADVELARDVRRRVRIDVRGARRVDLRVVEALLLPGPLPAFLDAVGLVPRGHLTHGGPSYAGAVARPEG